MRKGRLRVWIAAAVMALGLTGCGDETPEISDVQILEETKEESPLAEPDSDSEEKIASIYRDIYHEAIEANAGDSREMMRYLISGLGERGYAAVDSENQFDMAGAEQALEFCEAADEKKSADLTMIVIEDQGFCQLDLKTENGRVNIVRDCYQCDKDGEFQKGSGASYEADLWQYTEDGYLIFEGSYESDVDFALTLRDVTEHMALRILPLDETCRELNRKYILPVGYEQNNMFLTDWSEEDFGDLDFYDIFDRFYPTLYQQPAPYVSDENLQVGSAYQIPEDLFENVIMTHFKIDRERLRSKTKYVPKGAAYEYRPRGFYEAEYPDLPYPEVVDYAENPDGTITLTVHAVYPDENTSRAYSHKTVIRPLNNEEFQYVSNEMISSEDDMDIWWHCDRLTEEEWQETYGGNE